MDTNAKSRVRSKAASGVIRHTETPLNKDPHALELSNFLRPKCCFVQCQCLQVTRGFACAVDEVRIQGSGADRGRHADAVSGYAGWSRNFSGDDEKATFFASPA